MKNVDSDIIIPDPAVRYLLLQRTLYLWGLTRALLRINSWAYHKMVLLESVVRRKRAKKLFRKSIQRDFNDIAPYLPTNLGEVLDIGCGLGCINILINRHYENKRRPHFFLFDKTSLGGSIYYGWSERGAFYNSLQLAENLHY